MSDAPEDPVQLGRYELALPLSHGPLGELWAATVTDGPETGRVVAVRRVRLSGLPEEVRKRAVSAAEISKGLRHPKVAAVLDVFADADELVIVSEHVDGESLATLMRNAASQKHPILPSVAVAIARDATDALIAARAHFADSAGAPVPYGGLVPEGLVIAGFGDTMLMEPSVLGTLGDAPLRAPALSYRAPEQLGTPPTCDERSDVFAIGVLLWEMLANRGLFRSSASAQADAEADVRKLLLSGEIPALDSLPRAGAPLPAGLIVLAGRALLRDPEQRLQSLAALRSAFDELPRESIAGSEQVVAMLERLARNTLEARRSLLGQMGDGRLSASPESNRTTARPAGPETAVPVVIPVLGGAPIDAETFARQEAPTAPRRKLTPVSLAKPTGASEKPETQPRPPAPPRTTASPITAPSVEAVEPLLEAAASASAPEAESLVRARESTGTGLSLGDDEPAPKQPTTPALRRFAPVIVVAVGVAIVLLAILSRSGSSEPAAPPTGSAQTPPGPISAALPEPRLAPPPTSENVPGEPAASLDPTSVPAPSAPAASAKVRDPRETAPRPRGSGKFRPKGI